MAMDRNKTMKELFDEFNAATKQLDGMAYVFNTMSRNLDASKVAETESFTATDSVTVINGAHQIQSPGAYKFITKGNGKASYAIKDSTGLNEIARGVFDDSDESDEVVLGNGDMVYFHASADYGCSESITLVQSKSLFELMAERLSNLQMGLTAVNNRLDSLVNEYSVTAMVDEDSETLVLKSSAGAVDE
jgi:hypothetical protein